MLKKIIFHEMYDPFEKGTEIFFDDNKNQKELIKFYLLSKGLDETFSDRVRIDLIAGMNGSGKSRLCGYILSEQDTINNTINEKNNSHEYYYPNKFNRHHTELGSAVYFFNNESQSIMYFQNEKEMKVDEKEDNKINSSTKKLIQKLEETGRDETSDVFSMIRKQTIIEEKYKKNNTVNELKYLEKISDKDCKEIFIFENMINKTTGKVKNLEIILDDFFVLSPSIKDSVNHETFSNTLSQNNLNKFKCKLYNFSLEHKKIREAVSIFLNMKDTEQQILTFEYKKDRKDDLGGHLYFLEFDVDDNFRESRNYMNEKVSYESLLPVFCFFADILTGKNKVQYANFNHLGISNVNYIKRLRISLSDLFIATVDHFWENMSIDDSFIKGQGVESEKYKKFRIIANLLSIFLTIFDSDFLDFFDSKYKKEVLKKKHKNAYTKYINHLKLNTHRLLELLDILEKEGHSAMDKEYKREGLKSIYDIGKIRSYNFTDQLMGSKYSSQYNASLLLNLLFGFTRPEIESDKEEVKNLLHEIMLFFVDIQSYIGKEKKGPVFQVEEKQLEPIEVEILSSMIWDVDFVLKNEKAKITRSFNDLSAGEKTIIVRFTNIFQEIQKKSNKDETNIVVLVDEPDTHLHPERQKQYIQKLLDVFSVIKDTYIHFIIATHSPFIMSDFTKENIILLKDGKPQEKETKTFGANYIDILNDGFFFGHKTMLIGSFAEETIKKLAIAKRFLMIGLDNIKEKNLQNEDKKVYQYLIELEKSGKIGEIDKMIENIGDDFLKDNLLYFS